MVIVWPAFSKLTIINNGMDIERETSLRESNSTRLINPSVWPLALIIQSCKHTLIDDFIANQHGLILLSFLRT